MLFSNVLRIAGRTSVKVLSNLFGIDGELYYPKGYESGRSGYDDEIIYNETPDWTGKFLAPFVFAGAKQHFGGFFDELNGDEKAIYFDDQMEVPINSLIVFNMPAGNQLYKVYDLQSNNDDLGHIYTKAIVVPVTKDNIHTKTSQELNKEYAANMVEKEIDVDSSTEEFLNDLLGQNMADIEEFATQPKKEIIQTDKIAGDDKILSISDEDLL
jgi:hypothetical protein